MFKISVFDHCLELVLKGLITSLFFYVLYFPSYREGRMAALSSEFETDQTDFIIWMPSLLTNHSGYQL